MQVIACLDDALGHVRLGLLEVAARVIDLLVADLAVNLEHAVVVGQHVPGNRSGEGVLGVGVDVHLHHTEAQRILDLRLQRARATVEHEVERLRAVGQAQLGGCHPLSLGQHLRLEHHIARLVDTVHIAEGRSQQVPAVLAGAECVDCSFEVLGAGVKLLVELRLDAVFLAAHDADLHLEDDLGGGGEGEQFAGDREVLGDRHR